MYDIAVIGGGVNGCGVARDAAGRGLSVFLAERSDLASGTSSASTKLIHGGLRYLEQYEFGLVRQSLIEREVLWAMAPHIISPLRFVLPHHMDRRPVWLIRLGLFLYDHLGGRRRLPRSRFVDLRREIVGQPLRPEFVHGFEYSDCWVDDARLVVLNAVDAARLGAEIRVRTDVTSATRQDNQWMIEVGNGVSGERETIAARTLVNAAGPWISEVISRRIGLKSETRTRLVKGSHIVVPRLFESSNAYIIQNADRRFIFAIPYEADFTLIGTTDIDFAGDPDRVTVSAHEIAYLCGAMAEHFAAAIEPDEVVWSYSGVRPLYDDGKISARETTRDYLLELQADNGAPALLNIFGGKMTTYRRLAEDALELLQSSLPSMGAPWTRGSVLPGGDFPVDRFEELVDELQAEFPVIDAKLARRLARSYGTLARGMLSGVKDAEDLGIHFGAGLYQREVEYLARNEWAMTAEDIVWRRSKLGLRMTGEETRRLADWLKDKDSTVTGSSA